MEASDDEEEEEAAALEAEMEDDSEEEEEEEEEVATGLKRKAAEIGADAVIITLFGGDHSLTSEWTQDGRDMDKTFSRIVGIALKFYEDK